MFIDEAKIWVKAGDGGHGCISFRREIYVAKGGPNGGNGGKGGDVYLETAEDVDTLIDFALKHHWKAKNGLPGEGSNCTGESGDDLVIRVPVGTIVAAGRVRACTSTGSDGRQLLAARGRTM